MTVFLIIKYLKLLTYVILLRSTYPIFVKNLFKCTENRQSQTECFSSHMKVTTPLNDTMICALLIFKQKLIHLYYHETLKELISQPLQTF